MSHFLQVYKCIPLYKMSWRRRRDYSCISTDSLTSALEGIGCQRHGPIALARGKDNSYPLLGVMWAPWPVWTGAKCPGLTGFQTRNFHPLECRRTVCFIPAAFLRLQLNVIHISVFRLMDLAEYSLCQWSALISLLLLSITCHCWLVRPPRASVCIGFSRVFTVPMVCTHFFAPAVHHLSLLVGSSS